MNIGNFVCDGVCSCEFLSDLYSFQSMGGDLVEGVVEATTIVGVALPTEAGGDTPLSEGEWFSQAYIHVCTIPTTRFISGGQVMLPPLTNWLFLHLVYYMHAASLQC